MRKRQSGPRESIEICGLKNTSLKSFNLLLSFPNEIHILIFMENVKILR